MKREHPGCVSCGNPLMRNIEKTGIHADNCPWNYFIKCKCGYQNSISKLLGFWAGCSQKCQEENYADLKPTGGE